MTQTNRAKSELSYYVLKNGRLVPKDHPVFGKRVRVRWGMVLLYLSAFSAAYLAAAYLVLEVWK